jgi:hypothetical protein
VGQQRASRADSASRQVNADTKTQKYHDPAYTRMLDKDKSYYREKAEKLQEKLNQSNEKISKLEVENAVLTEKSNTFKFFDRFHFVGIFILTVLGVANQYLIPAIGIGGYFALLAFGVALEMVYLCYRLKKE